MTIQTESKLKQLFLENPFAKKLDAMEVKNSTIQQQTKLDKMFSPKTFAERWKFIDTVAVAVGLICNYFSFVTAFAIIFYLFYLSVHPIAGAFGAAIISVIPASILTLLIELVKRHVSANFLQDAIQFRVVSGGMFLFLAGCCGFSILVSYYGAKEIPKYLATDASQENFLALYKLDSVTSAASSQHDKEILAQSMRIDTFEFANTNSKGSIRHGALSTQAILQAELTELKKEKRQALAKIATQYETDKKEAIALDKTQQQINQTENSKISDKMAYAAIFCEFLFLLCMAGHWFYSWKTQQERYIDSNEIHNDISIDDNRNETDTPESPGPRTGVIGFKKYNDNDNDNRKDDNRKDEIQLPVCGNCKSKFLPKHHKQIYCDSDCKEEAWEQRTGKKLIKTKTKPQ